GDNLSKKKSRVRFSIEKDTFLIQLWLNVSNSAIMGFVECYKQALERKVEAQRMISLWTHMIFILKMKVRNSNLNMLGDF
ncbi:hypothetical protein CR513_51010, partial [Mucuna pruriens]